MGVCVWNFCGFEVVMMFINFLMCIYFVDGVFEDVLYFEIEVNDKWCLLVVIIEGLMINFEFE